MARDSQSLASRTLCCRQNAAEGTRDNILARNQQRHSQTVPELQDLNHSKSQRSEPLQSHPTPELPWHTVAIDLFKTKNYKYLLLVD